MFEENKKCGCENMKGMLMPEVDFSTFIMSLSSSALVHLGEVADPETGKNVFFPQIAKQSIDLLGMLQDKFKNGLTHDEERLLCDLLCSLRLKYVNKTK
jgi:hypothetical protein